MKAYLLSAVPQNGGEEMSCKFELSNGEFSEIKEAVLSANDFIAQGLSVGEIDPDLLEEIFSAAEIYAAVKKGIYLLGYGASSRKNLAYKLKMKGFPQDSAIAAAKILCEKGYIDENRDASRLAEICVSKLWGKKKIAAHLYEKGYGDKVVARIISSLNEDEMTENCAKLIEKKYGEIPTERPEREKMYAYLMRSGHTADTIKSAIASFR